MRAVRGGVVGWLVLSAGGCAPTEPPAAAEWVDPMDPDDIYFYDPDSMEDLDLGVGGGPGTADHSEGVSSTVYEGEFYFELVGDEGVSTCLGGVWVEALGHVLEGEVRCVVEGVLAGEGELVGLLSGETGGDGSLQAELDLWHLQTRMPGQFDGESLEATFEDWYSSAHVRGTVWISLEATRLP